MFPARHETATSEFPTARHSKITYTHADIRCETAPIIPRTTPEKRKVILRSGGRPMAATLLIPYNLNSAAFDQIVEPNHTPGQAVSSPFPDLADKCRKTLAGAFVGTGPVGT